MDQPPNTCPHQQVKTVKVTNARGFCAEIATAITVAVASRYGGCADVVEGVSTARFPACADVNALGGPNLPYDNTTAESGTHCSLEIGRGIELGAWYHHEPQPTNHPSAGLPVSTTMTITGGLIGIGCLEGFKGINYKVLFRVRPAVCRDGRGRARAEPPLDPCELRREATATCSGL